MRTIVPWAAVCLLVAGPPCGVRLHAQVTAAEYFIDADPGVGNGTSAALASGPGDAVNTVLSLDGSLLGAGFHTLSMRFKGAGGIWGMAESRPIYVHNVTPPGPAGQVTAAEYFIDADPGVGNGIVAALASGPGDAVNTVLSLDGSLLGAGFHTLSMRFKGDGGIWGIAESRPIYVHNVTPPGPAGQVTAAEYFMDADPGVGNGIVAALASGPGDAVNTVLSLDGSLLGAGFHTLSMRFKGAGGIWGMAESRPIYVHNVTPPGPAGQVTAAEYFIDADPGVGNGIVAALASGPGDAVSTVFTLDGSLFTPGFHTLSMRFKDADGVWGIAESRRVYVFPPTPVPAGPIVAAEYFFNADPGVGHGEAVAVAPGNAVTAPFVADASALAVGMHVISIRFKDASGKWGIAGSRSFEVRPNDQCADAVQLPLRDTEDCPAMAITGSTAGATPSGVIDCTGLQYADVWYTLNTGEASMIAVEIGEAGAEGLGLQVLDACGGNVLYCAPGLSHTFAVTPSSTYWLQVYSATATGGFTICASAVTQVTYYSQQSGEVTDPIWDIVTLGTPGPATFSPYTTMVVQGGHTVTNTGNVSVYNLTVIGNLQLDENTTFTVHGDDVILNGSVNALEGSELALAGAEAEISGLSAQTLWDLSVNTPSGTTLYALLGIQGTLQLEDGATFHAGNGRLTLLSNPEGTGRLGIVPATATFTGDLTMQRYIPAGATNWRLLGSAVQGGTVENWKDDFITAGFPGSHYPNFDTPVGGPLWPSIRKHDEPVLQGSSLPQVGASVSGTGEALAEGRGFGVWCGDNLGGTAAFVVDVTGAPNIATTPTELPVSYTDRGNPAQDGWNLVSNPLPSAIDFTAIQRTNVENRYQVYDPAEGSMMVWDGDGPSADPGLTGIIASSQAFWVKADGENPSATLDENAKVAGDGGGLFGGDGYATLPVVDLVLSGSANGFRDRTKVIFGMGTSGYEDADILKVGFGHQQAPAIGTIAPTGELLKWSKFGAYDTDIAIPVAVRTRVGGSSTITMHVSQTSLSCLWLEDLQTGALTPVTDGAQYSFTQAPGTEMQQRFVLHATAPLAFIAEDGLCGPASGSAMVDVGAGPNDVTWTTATGTVLLEQPGTSGEASFTDVPAGQYTVRVSAPATVCGELVHDFSIGTEGQPVEMTIVAPASVLVDEAVLFTGVGTEGVSYFWDFGDGWTSTEAAPSHTFTSPGEYVVSLTVTLDDCSITTTTTVVVTFSTGVDDLTGVDANVWGGRESFIVEHGLEGGLLGIEVMDAAGRVWFAKNYAAVPGRITVPARDLATGVWFVRLTHEDYRETFRVPLVR